MYYCMICVARMQLQELGARLGEAVLGTAAGLADDEYESAGLLPAFTHHGTPRVVIACGRGLQACR